MNKHEEIKKNLDTIFKKGDLYDVISLKEGVNLRKYSFLKLNILLLSRILYGGVLIWEKIRQKLAPIEKVRKAQEQIRNYLGIKVDIVTYKEEEKTELKDLVENSYLSLMYIEDDVDTALYIDNLQKILNFIEVYHLDKAILRVSDIEDYFANINLDEFQIQGMRKVFGGYLDDGLNDEILFLNATDLANLIKKLQSARTNKNYIWDLRGKIEDLVIKKAVEDFYLDDDLDKLKEIVKVRLELILNSDNSHKDRIYGKVFETITISDLYVKIVTKKQNGEVIEDKIMTLYDYLDIANYQALILKMESLSDDKEVLLVSALYLYLCQDQEIKGKNNNLTLTLYDRIYKNYQRKQNKKIKRIRGLYSKGYKRYRNILEYISCFFIDFVLIIMIIITGASLDYLNGFLFRNQNSSILRNILDTIAKPYRYSLQLEIDLLREPIDDIGDVVVEVASSLSTLIGDVAGENEDKKIAIINNLNSDNELPKYFATNYAVDAKYNEGTVEYINSKSNTLTFDKVTPLFEVSYYLDNETLKNLIYDDKIDLSKTFFPVGNDYVLTSVIIRDLDSGKTFTFDFDYVKNYSNTLSSAAKDLLMKMKTPRITYTYGLSEYSQNFFVHDMKEKGYTGGKSEVKEAIVKGLDLSEDASLEEIWQAIKSKTYSTTPIKDAGLKRAIKTLDEVEYFETIASLDSLVCNLAASLAVESTNDLCYVVGYLNNGDNYLSLSEAHAWAMDFEGNIIEVTPSLSAEEENMLLTVLEWGFNNNIQIYTLLVLISLLIKKYYGKKIVLTLKIIRINNLLENPYIFNAYAKINDVLYGGINIPRKNSKIILLDKVYKDFKGFSRNDLNLLKEKLKQEEMSRKVASASIKLVNEIPNIESNYNEIRRILEKEK